MTRTVLPKRPTARLRRKNQITLPEVVLSELGVAQGDRFLVSVEDGAINLEPVRRSYAGSLKGLWPDNWMEELRREREASDQRELAWTGGNRDAPDS